MANNIWSNYTEKTATPVDTDEMMARDSTDGKNKRLLFGTFWKWVAKKLNEATISELETENKTVIGALNYLNGNTIQSVNLDSYTERDFNNYTSQGWYSFGSTPESLGLINCPGRSTGSLCVIILTSIQIQVWIDVDNNFYFRSRYPLYEWGTWHQIKFA